MYWFRKPKAKKEEPAVEPEVVVPFDAKLILDEYTKSRISGIQR